MRKDQTVRPNRRRLQFGLRALLLAVTLLSAVFGLSVRWVQNSKEWIRQRHDVIDQGIVRDSPVRGPTTAPGGLWLFGEDGMSRAHCRLQDLEFAERLFPEALVLPVVELEERQYQATNRPVGGHRWWYRSEGPFGYVATEDYWSIGLSVAVVVVIICLICVVAAYKWRKNTRSQGN